MPKRIVKRTREQVIKRWVKALRSGDYEQTEGELKDDNGFCCLGVLCDLAVEDGGEEWVHGYMGYEYKGTIGVLPKVMHNFIFPARSRLQNKLIEMNDGGKSFKEIADVIEKKLL